MVKFRLNMAVSVTPVIGHVVNTKCALKGSNRWNDLLYRIKSATTSQYSYTSFTYRPIIHLHTSHTMAPVHFLRCQYVGLCDYHFEHWMSLYELLWLKASYRSHYRSLTQHTNLKCGRSRPYNHSVLEARLN